MKVFGTGNLKKRLIQFVLAFTNEAFKIWHNYLSNMRLNCLPADICLVDISWRDRTTLRTVEFPFFSSRDSTFDIEGTANKSRVVKKAAS